MDKEKEKLIEKMLYNSEMENEEKIKEINKINDPDVLHIYAFNYNWDDGLEIPECIINNEVCDLGTALMIFYLAEGDIYLEDKEDNNDDLEWFEFITKLYNMIIEDKFIKKDIKFDPPLSKVELYKFKKKAGVNDNIFFEERGDRDLNIFL